MIFIEKMLTKYLGYLEGFTIFRGKSEIMGTLSIDSEMHDDDVRNSRKTGSRVSFSARKTIFKQRVILKRRRLLVR